MAPSEYISIGTGPLKLKGSAGVEKKKKKKKKPKRAEETLESSTREAQPEPGNDPTESFDEPKDVKTVKDRSASEDLGKQVAGFKANGGKTAAELRFEEQRRRRLDERLRREGVKTHKERVEDLNRYLSTLSEHHDMPRIGPG